MFERFNQFYKNPLYYDATTGLFKLEKKEINDADIPSLCKFLEEHPEIKSLDLSQNNITDVGALELAKNNNLTMLDLHWNNIGEAGAAAFAQNHRLTTLNLSLNCIGAAGATLLAKNDTLTSLNLNWNRIEAAGAAAFANNSRLTTLHLAYCKIGDEGVIPLAKNGTLLELTLIYNDISDKGALALLENKTLTLLHINCNKFPLAIFNSLKESINQNQERHRLQSQKKNIAIAKIFCIAHADENSRLSHLPPEILAPIAALATADKPGFPKYAERYLAILSIFNDPSKKEPQPISEKEDTARLIQF